MIDWLVPALTEGAVLTAGPTMIWYVVEGLEGAVVGGEAQYVGAVWERKRWCRLLNHRQR